MCEKCEGLRKGKDLGGSYCIATDKKLEGNENRGFYIRIMKLQRHYRLLNGFREFDRSYEKPLYIIEAIHYEHDVEPHTGHSTAAEIAYCPFCGEKF